MRKSVLLLDADIDDRDLFCLTVDEISPEIDCKQFSNVLDASAYLEKTEMLPDIIFAEIDIHLRGSVEFLKDIKSNKKLKDIQIYIYSTPYVIKECGDILQEQVKGYLFKTPDFKDFKRSLREILES